jgi:prepilin-type N-terminal cleavage/methylation domain-containing protein
MHTTRPNLGGVLKKSRKACHGQPCCWLPVRIVLASGQHRAGAARGFSLVEVLVATAIASIIFTVGFVTITGTIAARNQATASVRAAESARQFFSLLENDLRAAHPRNIETYCLARGNIYPGLNSPNPLLVEDAQLPDREIIQFYTRADTQDVSDEYVFVRYYVNHYDDPTQPDEYQYTLCREVVSNPDLQDAINPRTLTQQPNNPAALFEGVHSLQILFGQWDPSNKTYTWVKSPAAPGMADALKVTLELRDKFNFSQQKIWPRRTFVKVLPIPESFNQ